MRVNVMPSPKVGGLPDARDEIVSDFLQDVSKSDCDLLQNSVAGAEFFEEFNAAGSVGGISDLSSECTEPKLGEDGRTHVTCLSQPTTMTPGGVINSIRATHLPYPRDRRVVPGVRTWEFVEGDPLGPDGRGTKPVPTNRLYVHHLAGNVVLGQGAEGLRRSDVDVPFPKPYALLTGEEADVVGFHIIDLRNVTDWLRCVECRCRDGDGTYLDAGGSGDGETGGVACCSNCTDLSGPTVDYRMRYNVTYSDIPEDESVTDLTMVSADVSPVLGRNIEFDVPGFRFLDPANAKPTDPTVQRLERTGPFRELFKMSFFMGTYSGPPEVKILRCVGHLHIAAVGMWLLDAETGEVLCEGIGTHGTDPDTDKGFLTSVSVESLETPYVIPQDRNVTLVTEYNATEPHTGVMGMWFLFVSTEREVSRSEASLTVRVCERPVCDASTLPESPAPVPKACVDALPDSPACSFGNLCDCDEFINAPESQGCGGMYESEWGDVSVDSVCAKSCDACDYDDKCTDALPSSPACTYGGLCDCETFVNAPESTGCGGTYSSDWGNVPVNSMCGRYCDACPDANDPVALRGEILTLMERDLTERCRYDTEECRRTLSNVYSCGVGRPGMMVDPNVYEVVREHGQRLAAEHSMLGHKSFHKLNVMDSSSVYPCAADVDDAETAATTGAKKSLGAIPEADEGAEGEDASPNRGAAVGGILVAAFAIVAGGTFVARRRRGRRSEKGAGAAEKDVETTAMRTTAHTALGETTSREGSSENDSV